MDLDVLIDAALRKLWASSYLVLTPIEQVLVAVSGVEVEVNNGGFDQYYFNSAGDQAQVAPAKLRAIGAATTADIVESANSAFGSDGPPMDRGTRQERLEQIRDGAAELWSLLEQKFYAYPDNLRGLLERYASQH
jgi:hypothetical protein